MANWYGSARSNYFRVKDEERFLQWVKTLPGVSADSEEHDAERTFCLLEEYSEGWPCYLYDETSGEEGELDLAAEIALTWHRER